MSLHQLLSGGKTSLAAEYTLPLNGEPPVHQQQFSINNAASTAAAKATSSGRQGASSGVSPSRTADMDGSSMLPPAQQLCVLSKLHTTKGSAARGGVQATRVYVCAPASSCAHNQALAPHMVTALLLLWPCLHVCVLLAGKSVSAGSADAYELTLGVAQRLDTGGLVKARLRHTGQLSLLYQQAVSGVGQLAFSVNVDPLKLSREAPALGVSLTL